MPQTTKIVSAANRRSSVSKKRTTKVTTKKIRSTPSRSVPPAGVLTSGKPAATMKNKQDYIPAVGRRKTAVARVRLLAGGSGQVMVNGLTVERYFGWPEYIQTVYQPLQILGLEKSLDARIKVTGGGKASQAVAIRHGLARALVLFNEDYRKVLRPAGFLTRDSRIKERKKPGLKRARRAPQFAKR